MCATDSHILLTETKESQISWCKGCRRYSLLYRSSCLSFSQSELISFRQLLESLVDENFSYRFLQTNYALIRHDFASMGICVTQKEAKQLSNLIHEALTVNEVFGIIYNQK